MSTPPVASRILDVLKSGSVQRIDFTLAGIRVDASGFHLVANSVLNGIAGLGVSVEVVKLPQGVASNYNSTRRVLQFSRADYGLNLNERGHIVHECVHAMNDLRAHIVYTPNGPKFPTRLEDEATAYLAA